MPLFGPKPNKVFVFTAMCFPEVNKISHSFGKFFEPFLTDVINIERRAIV